MLVTVGFDEMVNIWDLKSGRRLRTIYVPKVSHCNYSPNDQYVAMTIINSVEIFTINELYELNAFEGKGILVGANFFDFSPDSQSVASLTAKNTITVRNIKTRKKLITLEVNDNIWRCAYSPDGQRLATSGFDGATQIWDVGNGNCLNVLKGHKNGVNVCRYSPDGSVLVSVGNDCIIHIWNANEGQLQGVLKGHYSAITGCTLLPNSRYMASSSYDGTVRVWDLEIMKEIRRTYLLPDNNWATLDPINNHIIQVSGDAWRWLGWQGRDLRTGRMERWPAETFGPLPEWMPPSSNYIVTYHPQHHRDISR
jgi:WD40 repeat protein